MNAGAVQVRDGRWIYASGLAMKQSPFSQARRNRYALVDKLCQRLGREVMALLVDEARQRGMAALIVTHAPDQLVGSSRHLHLRSGRVDDAEHTAIV